MVKALISGILGKKDSSAPASTSEPPDELPPLMEDAVAASAPAASKPMVAATAPAPLPTTLPPMSTPVIPAPSAPTQNPPDALPELDFEKKLNALDFTTEDEKKNPQMQPMPSQGAPSAALPFASNELPAEIQKAKMAKQGSEKPAQLPSFSSLPKSAAMQKMAASLSSMSPAEAGFFSSMLEHIQKNDGMKEKLLEGDLYSRMNNYWELKKREIKSGKPLSTQEQLEADLVGVLEQLKVLEGKWQVQRLALDEDIKFLEQRERDIQLKSEELRRITNELMLFRNVTPDKYFRLRNGVVLKNLHDLIDVLEIIDDATFSFHVNSDRNDFASWIGSTYMDPKLAEKISRTQTKTEMIETLRKNPVVVERLNKKNARLEPSQYFYLANGVVLKSLREFSDALKEMDDSLFDIHVTDDKNDFANWARGVFKEEILAQNLSRCRRRKEMVAALELYL